MRRRAVLLIAVMMALVMIGGVALAASGDLDPTFGRDGKVLTDIGPGEESAEALVVQRDGKLVAAGSSDVCRDDCGFDRFALTRYKGD